MLVLGLVQSHHCNISSNINTILPIHYNTLISLDITAITLHSFFIYLFNVTTLKYQTEITSCYNKKVTLSFPKHNFYLEAFVVCS